MKVLVISDSHGHIANLKHVVGFGQKMKIGAIIHAGDWNTIESVETVLFFGIPLYTVLGNADIDALLISKLKSQISKFGEQYLEIELGGRRIGITHKPSDNKKYFLDVSGRTDKKLDVIFNGHMHSKDDRVTNGIRVVRPGAIINGNNFAIYETINNEVEFIEDDS